MNFCVSTPKILIFPYTTKIPQAAWKGRVSDVTAETGAALNPIELSGISLVSFKESMDFLVPVISEIKKYAFLCEMWVKKFNAMEIPYELTRDEVLGVYSSSAGEWMENAKGWR